MLDLSDGLAGDAGHLAAASQVAVVLDPHTGRVLAIQGGFSYARTEFNRGTQALRQPGSAFKPFVYLAALERGLTPETLRLDAPIEMKGWRPENYTREYFGNVTLTRALARLGRRRAPVAA